MPQSGRVPPGHGPTDSLSTQIFDPADELTQSVPIGGADRYGHELPELVRVPVQVVNIIRTRVAPALVRISGRVTVPANSRIRLVGETPQRSRLVIAGSGSQLLICDDATSPGFPAFYAAGNFPIFDTGAVWIENVGTAIEVGYWHEMHAG